MSDSRKKELPRGFSRRQMPRMGMEIPINLERILMDAARDEAFRERLLEDPAGTAVAGGFELTGTERAMLAAMDRSMLEAMVRRFGAPRARRSGFAKGVAAAMAGSMIISVSTGCVQSAGIIPEPPEDAQTEDVQPVDLVSEDAVEVDWTDELVGGIFPDWPPDAPDLYEEADLEDEDAADDAEEESDG